jgi:hypothetical protein
MLVLYLESLDVQLPLVKCYAKILNNFLVLGSCELFLDFFEYCT